MVKLAEGNIDEESAMEEVSNNPDPCVADKGVEKDCKQSKSEQKDSKSSSDKSKQCDSDKKLDTKSESDVDSNNKVITDTSKNNVVKRSLRSTNRPTTPLKQEETINSPEPTSTGTTKQNNKKVPVRSDKKNTPTGSRSNPPILDDSLKYKYFESLDLVPSSCATTKTPEKQKVTLDNDCTKIVEKDVSAKPTPATPRSSRSIMSQLSSPGATQKNLFSPTDKKDSDTKDDKVEGSEDADEEKKDDENEESSDDDSSDDSDDDTGFTVRRLNKLLTSVDLSSPLGDLVRGHVQSKKDDDSDDDEKKQSNQYEDCCGTDKDSVNVKLRVRAGGYPVTYKKKRGEQVWFHRFNFTREDVNEFYYRLRSGLTREARRLRRKLRPCKVKLTNENAEGIQKLKAKAKADYWKAIRSHDARRENVMRVQGMAPRMQQGGSSQYSPSYLAQLLHSTAQMNQNRMMQQRIQQQQIMQQKMQQQRQMQQIMLEAQRRYQSNVSIQGDSPAAVQQRMLLNQRIMAAAAAACKATPGQSTSLGQKTQPKPVKKSSDDVICLDSDEDDEPSPKKARIETSPQYRPGPKSLTRPSVPMGIDGRPQYRPGPKSLTKSTPEIKSAYRPGPKSRMQQRPSPPAGTGTAGTKMDSQAVMFKCHLCGTEILFTQSTTRFIREHFANNHQIRNVQILQNIDKNNQVSFSIVEGPPVPEPAAGQLDKAQRTALKSVSSNQPSPSSTNKKPRTAVEDVICID